MDDDIFLPLVIAAGMFAVVYAGVSMGEYQGHAFHSKCIEECYEEHLARMNAPKPEVTEAVVKEVKKVDPAKRLYAGCAGCHGQQGEGGAFPKLAGQTSEYITSALVQYQNRETRGRKSMIMWGQAQALSTRDINLLGTYISEL
jgi:cytochrome c553